MPWRTSLCNILAEMQTSAGETVLRLVTMVTIRYLKGSFWDAALQPKQILMYLNENYLRDLGVVFVRRGIHFGCHETSSRARQHAA